MRPHHLAHNVGDAPDARETAPIEPEPGVMPTTGRRAGVNRSREPLTSPLATWVQVNFRDGGSGETSATSITCDNTGTTPSLTPATGWDDSVTHEGIAIDPSPRTVTCTIVIDP